MKIKVVRCNNCKDYIFSRAPHDFRSCSCGSISVDGGRYDIKDDMFSYERLIGNSDNFEGGWRNNWIIELDVTPKELYDDWNYFEESDIYGKYIGGER